MDGRVAGVGQGQLMQANDKQILITTMQATGSDGAECDKYEVNTLKIKIAFSKQHKTIAFSK